MGSNLAQAIVKHIIVQFCRLNLTAFHSTGRRSVVGRSSVGRRLVVGRSSVVCLGSSVGLPSAVCRRPLSPELDASDQRQASGGGAANPDAAPVRVWPCKCPLRGSDRLPRPQFADLRPAVERPTTGWPTGSARADCWEGSDELVDATCANIWITMVSTHVRRAWPPRVS